MLRGLADNFAGIIREAGAGPLAFSAFASLLISVLGVYLFAQEPILVRLGIFIAIFCIVALFALIILFLFERNRDASFAAGTTSADKRKTNFPTTKTLYCSFCGKSQYVVKKLIAGPAVFICDECADLTFQITTEVEVTEREEKLAGICELTLEASNPALEAHERQRILSDARDLADRIKSVRRDRSGDILAGSRLQKIIGAGNFGTVWLAYKEPEYTESGDQRVVAVKKFDEDKLAIGLMLWRYLRGIRAIEHLSNVLLNPPRSIVKIYEIDAKNLCFSMEYYPNGDLESISSLGWSSAKKLEVFLSVCEAVHFAHIHHVVHRDIKPANIILSSDYRASLTDFDIADLRFARTQSIYAGSLGTPQFAAPEQLVGDNLIAYPTADIYSLGKLLYFIFKEVAPPLGSTEGPRLPKYLQAIEQPVMRRVIARAIQHKPEDRYQSVSDMLKDMKELIDDYPGIHVPNTLLVNLS